MSPHAFLILILLLFVCAGPLVGFLSGWQKLARLHPPTDVRDGNLFRVGLARIGGCGYKGNLRLTTGISHLHFSVLRLFRLGHPPFSVPWCDISVSFQKYWFQNFMRFTLARAGEVRCLLPAELGKRVIAASQGQVRLV